jgi:hypothetical protein
MVQSGNGKHDDSEIETVFEHLDDETQQVQDRWAKINEEGDREIAFSDEIRSELEIEEEDDESKSD